MFAIGIGKAKSTELDIIKTTSEKSKYKTKFMVSEFKTLSTILDQLLSAACMAKIDECNCKGFCGVDNQCLCPSECKPFDGNLCKQAYKCEKSNFGCFYK